MNKVDELYSQIETKDKEVTKKNLCLIFVNWAIYYAKIVYDKEDMPFEEFLDNVTEENLHKLSNNSYLCSLYAPDNSACYAAQYVSSAADYAKKKILPGVGKCMSEVANLATKYVGNKFDYNEESETIKVVLLENAIKE